MSTLQRIIGYAIHLDTYLEQLVGQLGAWVYVALFAVIFAETGLVVMPFLPGESLLLTASTLAGADVLDIRLLAPVLFVAAWIADIVNYSIGRWLGTRIVTKTRLIKPEHLETARKFYARHGGKTIIVARFLPIVRTLGPFVAGIAEMPYKRLVPFAAIAAAVWTAIFVGAGYWFGTVPWVRDRLVLALPFIALLSTVPGIIAYLWRRRHPQATGGD